jgi:hypothetical protein
MVKKSLLYCVHVEHFMFLSLVVQSHKSISKSCLKHPVHRTAKRSPSAKTVSNNVRACMQALSEVMRPVKKGGKCAAVFKTVWVNE